MTPSLRQRTTWIAILYFLQGLPFGVFYEALPVYYRTQGVSLKDIGLMSLLQLPWTLKFLWSPLIDRTLSPRRWIIGAASILILSHVALAATDVSAISWSLLAILFSLTMASATQDIAIDSAFVRLTPRGEEGTNNGIRVTAFRVAMIIGGGATVMLTAYFSWSLVFVAVAFMLMVCMLSVARMPLQASSESIPLREWFFALWQWLGRKSAWPVFAFILLYKLGDASMGIMIRPYWVDRGVSPAEIGFITTTVGVFATIVGALAGGWCITRIGLYKGLIALGALQAMSNLAYAGVAYWDIGRSGLYAASLSESFCSGLGTAALLAFLTACTSRSSHSATQYAILSAMTGLTRTVAGAASGFATEAFGYAPFFAFTVLLALPAYVFLPWVKQTLAPRACS